MIERFDAGDGALILLIAASKEIANKALAPLRVKIGKELGVPIIEQNIPREMLYIADEVFFSGTAAEISPIRSIDRVTIGDGSRGPIAQKFQQRYFEYVNDEREDIYGWHDYVK